jgi:hypothetical protein
MCRAPSRPIRSYRFVLWFLSLCSLASIFCAFVLVAVLTCGGAYALPVLLLNTVGSGFS